MVQTGKFNKLKISRFTPHGAYLDSDKGEILLPSKYITEGSEIGTEVDVFVFFDSDDRLLATTQKPFAQAGEFAFLKVKEVNKIGAFLDWGLNKDLLVPYREQQRQLEKGKSYIVYVFREEDTGRLAASSNVNKFLKAPEGLTEGQQVELIVTNATDLGFKVIVDHKFEGLLYENEIFRPVRIGDKMPGFVKKIREDGKLDISLTRQGKGLVDDSRQIILDKLKKAGGYLPFNDASDPNDIALEFGISKKAFKKAIGGLFKDRVIMFVEDGFRLVTED